MKHAATAKSLSLVRGSGSEYSPNHALWTHCHVSHNESEDALQLAADTSRSSTCRAAALDSSDAAASSANPLHALLDARTVGKSDLVAPAAGWLATAAAGVGGAALNHVMAGALGAQLGAMLVLELAAPAPTHHAAGVPGAGGCDSFAAATGGGSAGLALVVAGGLAAPFPGPFPLRLAASRAGPRAAKARPPCVTRPAQSALVRSLHWTAPAGFGAKPTRMQAAATAA